MGSQKLSSSLANWSKSFTLESHCNMSPKLKKIKLESSVENQKSDLETEDQNTPPPVKIVKTGEEYFDPEEYDEFSKWINTVEKEIMLPRDSPVSKRAEKNFKTSKK